MNEPDKRIQELYTVPNVITVVRLLLVPVAFTVLVATDAHILAFVLFAIAASSDFLDGYIARTTGTESEFGAMLDPLVDRLLLAAGVIGLYVVGRLPLWILICLLVRDAYLLYGNVRLQAMGIERIRILFIGKCATAFLLVGFDGPDILEQRHGASQGIGAHPGIGKKVTNTILGKGQVHHE